MAESNWTNEDFLAPKGNITPSMFPGETKLDERVDEYISKAEELAVALTDDSLDRAVYHYVYWKVYEAIYTRMLSTPSTNILADQGTISWNQGQMDAFGALAKQHQTDFENLISEVSGAVANIPVSRSVATRFTW